MKQKSGAKELVKLAVIQLFITVAISLVVLYFFNARESISAFLGGLVSVLSSLYMAKRLKKSQNSVGPAEMLGQFYASVVVKFLLVLLMIGLCFIVIEVSVLSFILMYMFTYLVVNWLFLLVAEPD